MTTCTALRVDLTVPDGRIQPLPQPIAASRVGEVEVTSGAPIFAVPFAGYGTISEDDFAGVIRAALEQAEAFPGTGADSVTVSVEIRSAVMPDLRVNSTEPVVAEMVASYVVTSISGDVHFDEEIETSHLAPATAPAASGQLDPFRVQAARREGILLNVSTFLARMENHRQEYARANAARRRARALIDEGVDPMNSLAAVVASETVVRGLPTSFGDPVDTVGFGSALLITGSVPTGWFQVSREGQEHGWVHESAVRVQDAKSAPLGSPPIRRTEVRYSTRYSKKVAAVIGIDDYEHWPPLEGAGRDATRFANMLERQGFTDILELRDREATRARMLTFLGSRLAELADEDSLAVIYFAGHGQTEQLANGERRGYIVPADSTVDHVFATAISMEKLRDLANRIPAKHLYYVMDSCYSGLGMTRGIAAVGRSPGYVERLISRRAVQMITAGAEGEQAVEIRGQGIFTTYLVQALEGAADYDHDGFVTTSEIGAFVMPRVVEASDGRQSPQFGSLAGSGEIIFRVP